MTEQASTWIAGVDGFKHRWFVVLKDTASGEYRRRIVPTFADLLNLDERPLVVAVDIPIGLPEYTKPGGRACEREARRILGPRASSVFSALGRRVLELSTRAEAHRASVEAGGTGVGAQAFGLSRKLRDADATMVPVLQQTLYEVHPEVCFWTMNRRLPMPESKKTSSGKECRQQALIRSGFPADFIATMALDLRVPADDFLDACAALWTAARIAGGSAGRFPAKPDLDKKGLDQAIWF